MTSSNIPDFSRWASNRLEVLLEDYRDAMRSMKILHGTVNSDEYRLHERWARAIEAELGRRI